MSIGLRPSIRGRKRRRLTCENPSPTNIQTANAEKPKRKRGSTEARVIYELHRHGIYW
jgi:hypothetical protein